MIVTPYLWQESKTIVAVHTISMQFLRSDIMFVKSLSFSLKLNQLAFTVTV
jgi:hypothetical protein